MLPPRPTDFPQAFPSSLKRLPPSGSSTARYGADALGCPGWTADHPVLRACKFNDGNSARVDFCAFPRDVRGPRSSRSNTKTGRGWPGTEMGDQIGRPHNLLPSYLDRSSFCAPPKLRTIQDEHVDQIRSRVLQSDHSGQKKIYAKPFLRDSSPGNSIPPAAASTRQTRSGQLVHVASVLARRTRFRDEHPRDPG